jgi:hypothetical protein
MKKNMGSIDNVIRIMISLAIVILAITKVITGLLAIILLILSGIFVLTSQICYWPLNLPFRINTGKKTE